MAARRTKFSKNVEARDNDAIVDALIAEAENRNSKFRKELPKDAKDALTRRDARKGKKK